MTFVGTREQLGRHSEAERLSAAIEHVDKGKLARDALYRQRLNACAVDLEVALCRSLYISEAALLHLGSLALIQCSRHDKENRHQQKHG
jgi:hypothetical protein